MNKKDKAYIESLIPPNPPKLSDYDGDGYPDIFDCHPMDPNRDGFIGNAWNRLTASASRARQSARRAYAPAAASARRTYTQATHSARQSVARARAVARRIPSSPATARMQVARHIISRASPTYRRVETAVSQRIPTLEAIAGSGERFAAGSPRVQQAYSAVGEQVMRLPAPIKTVSTETFKFTRGGYKQFQEKPVTIAAHTAAFAAAGPVIGSLGRAAVAGRAALAARAPQVAAIPVVGRAMVATGRTAAPVVSKAAKYALPAMGALWGASIAQRIHATPSGMRSEEAGRIFMGEVVPMAAGLGALPAARAFRPSVVTSRYTQGEGIETLSKQFYIGKKRMPIGYEKMVSQQTATGAGKTSLAMESEYKAMVGQLKYSHTKFARGQIEGEYFLPTPKKPLQIGKVATTEAGAERLMLPAPAPKPTRFYAELSQRYTKAKQTELSGGRLMRWIESGKRKIEYGVQKPQKFEIPDVGVPPGTWGISGRVQLPRYGKFHPSYQTGLSAADSAELASLTGAPRPLQLSESLYFKKVPETSRYYAADDYLTSAGKPFVPTMPTPSSAHVPKHLHTPPAAKPPATPMADPMMERAPAPEAFRRRPEFAEPSTPYETPWAEPTMKRSPLTETKRATLPFKEPTEFKVPWAEPSLRTIPKRVPMPKPAAKRSKDVAPYSKTRAYPTPYTAPYPEHILSPSPAHIPAPARYIHPSPSGHPSPDATRAPSPKQDRKPSPFPAIYPYTAPAPAPAPSPHPQPQPAAKYTVPKPKPAPKPKPMPKPSMVPPPPHIAPKTPPVYPFMMDGGSAGSAPVRGKRKKAWKQKHEMLTLSDLLGPTPSTEGFKYKAH